MPGSGVGWRRDKSVGARRSPIQHRRSTSEGDCRARSPASAALLVVGPRRAPARCPAGFQETTAFGGLTNPTVVRFAPDGRVFVAEKSGLIKVFDGLGDTDRHGLGRPAHEGPQLLGPRPARHGPRSLTSPSTRWIYVLYTHDARSAARPRAGAPPGRPPTAARPRPGPTADGCVVSGRLSRLEPNGERAASTEDGDDRGLVPAVPEPFGRHRRVRPLGLRSTRARGDGASFNFTDYGQDGSPVNPCGDPPAAPTPTPPSAEGGALRSQDQRTRADATGSTAA